MSVGSTNYAKDLGERVEFGGYSDKSKNVVVPKDRLPALIEAFVKEKRNGRPIERLTEITMSAGPTDDFVRFLRQNM
jgi:hypothetical protein